MIPLIKLLLLFCISTPVLSEIISLAAGATAVSLLSGFMATFYYTKCHLFPCCSPPWVTFNNTFLQKEVAEKFYGQHLAANLVLKAVKSHLEKENPKKALVLSFHGFTGSGKNYLSKMIADSTYKHGMKSPYVHLFVSNLHFPDSNKVETYKNRLREWIRGNISLCERSLFIFDEIDKLPLQLMDAIKPFIDFYEQIDGVDARKSVFLFLSNAGGHEIAKLTLQYYQDGIPREEIKFKEMEEITINSAYNEGKGGLKTSELIANHLIDYFIPFLPLERRHVIMCVKDYLKQSGKDLTAQRVEAIADSIEYFPRSNPVFSSSGCKKVAQKTELQIMNEQLEEEERLRKLRQEDEL